MAATIAPGDVLIGAALVRSAHQRLFAGAARSCSSVCGFDVDTHVPELGTTVGDALLEPHRSYLPLIRPLLDGRRIKGMAHITGGGITDNLPRILPQAPRVIDRVVVARAADLPWLERTAMFPTTT